MIRLLFITDYSDSYANRLLKGIINYSKDKGQWSISRMPTHHKQAIGIEGILEVARKWEINVVIGTFEDDDDISMLRDNGIIVIAQDFKKMLNGVPNITGNYIGTGQMAARYFIDKGFRRFGFFGLKDVCWSDERYEGFRKEVKSQGLEDFLYKYNMQDIDRHWFDERSALSEWLKGLPKPIGIMACDDNQGNNLIQACISAGIKIPQEASILGVDNDELLCNLSIPTLSSIAVDIEGGGFQVAQLIEKLVESPDSVFEDIVLQPVKIVPRISTAAFATGDSEILKAVKFIHQNCRRKIPVDDVVEQVALSRRLLEIRFKEVTGESIYQYILLLRLKTFAEMLLETNEQVINIALSLGESDAKSISKKFKAVYGCSPNEYRLRNSEM
jgi:LacI family transcriptional regulator